MKSLTICTTKADYSLQETMKYLPSKLINKIELYYYSDLQIRNGEIFKASEKATFEGKKLLLRDASNSTNWDYTPLQNFLLHKYKPTKEIFESEFLTKYPNYHDKLYQVSIYGSYFNKIIIPNFVYPLTNKREQLTQTKFPTLAKDRHSCRNRGNTIIRTKEDFLEFNFSEKHLLQELIDFDLDIRLVFLNNNYLSATTRKRNEAGQLKLDREITDQIPDEIIVELKNLLQQVGLNFAGIDLLQKKNKYYFLEVNRSPQYKGTERVTRKPIGNMLLESLLR